MQFATAQQEMAVAHVRGAPGVLVSGLVWLLAGGVWARYGIVSGFYVLFFGGMLIFPGSLLISRVGFRAEKASRDNPLERLGLESTFTLFGGLLLAWCFLRVAPALAFPAMAVAVGTRYFVFRTIYGNPAYWVLGAALAVIGGLVALAHLTLPVNFAAFVGAIEFSFSIVLFLLGHSANLGKPSSRD